jgi:hypothetical protein
MVRSFGLQTGLAPANGSRDPAYRVIRLDGIDDPDDAVAAARGFPPAAGGYVFAVELDTLGCPVLILWRSDVETTAW